MPEPAPCTSRGPISNRVILITGVMAAGKSTVAQALAERLPKSVHLRGDTFRRFIVNGREEITKEPTREAIRQLRLRYELAVMVARRYHDAGFTVVYQDIILGEDLALVVDLLHDLPLEIVVLCPSPAAVADREAMRGKTGYGDWTVADLDESLREETPRIGYWLDTSGLTVEETVDRILAHLRVEGVDLIGAALMIVRPTARLLAFDSDGRLLLFKCRNDATSGPGFFWIAPGGGVEPGETDERAALRELWEETNIETSSTLGPCVLEREAIGRHADYGDQDIIYRDRYFTVHLGSSEIARLDPAAVMNAGYLEHRWWSPGELESTSNPVWPEELPVIVRQIATASPAEPG